MDDDQVTRDHAVSHMLAALSSTMPDRLRFYGGTALSRTLLSHGRLSEDVDLIAVGSWREVVADISRVLTRLLSADFGRPRFEPHVQDLRPRQAQLVRFPIGPVVRIHVMPEGHYPDWPWVVRPLEQRYADSPPATLSVPTRDAFVAWKSIAYLDRRAPRDLWDLAELARRGGFTTQAGALFASLGPLTSPPTDATIPRAPREDVWRRDLAHQTRLLSTADEARDVVVQAWSRVTTPS